jgi:hypothetical protein
MSVRLLSRAQIDDARRRLVMHLVVVPVTMISSACFVFGSFVGMMGMRSLTELNADGIAAALPVILIAITAVAAATPLMVMCHKLSEWIVAGTPIETAAVTSPPPELPGL